MKEEAKSIKEMYSNHTLHELNKESQRIAFMIQKTNPLGFMEECSRNVALKVLKKLIEDKKGQSVNPVAYEDLKQKVKDLTKRCDDLWDDNIKKTKEISGMGDTIMEQAEEIHDLETKMEKKALIPYDSPSDQIKAEFIVDNWEKFGIDDLDSLIE